MATNFPSEIDQLQNPNATDPLSNPSHSQQHVNLNDAVTAIQSKVGIDGSEDINSLDYRISSLEDSNAGSVVEDLGLSGNNSLVVTGIENKTVLDYFSKTAYRTVMYELQITKGSEYQSSSFKILNDGNDINMSEFNIVSNTQNSLATVTFEENSGIINLCVTPVSGVIIARYYRTALKV